MPRSSGRSSGGRSRSYSTSARPQARPSSRNTARSYSSGTKTQARPSAQNSARATQKSVPAKPTKKETPKAETKQAPPPQPTQQPHYTHSSGGNGFFSNMAQGFAFGAGSAVAHNAVNGVVNAVTGHNRDRRDDNAPVEEVEQVQSNQQVDPNDPCAMQRMDFTSCLEMNKNNVTECQFFFDSFKRCQERSQEFTGQSINRYEYSYLLTNMQSNLS